MNSDKTDEVFDWLFACIDDLIDCTYEIKNQNTGGIEIEI